MRICVVLSLVMLAGCSSWQAGQNTSDLIDTIGEIREVQVLRNIGHAIDHPSAVPAQVVLSQGIASASVSASATFLLPKFNLSQPNKQLNAVGSDTWTSTWQMIPVSSPGDLNRLRALYAYIVTSHSKDASESKQASAMKHLLAFKSSAENIEIQQASSLHKHIVPGPNREDVAEILIKGESTDCASYQRRFEDENQVYAQWLFWKDASDWMPVSPPPAADLEPIGTYNGHHLYISSRACLDDFILLVQRSVPSTQTAADQTLRPPATP